MRILLLEDQIEFADLTARSLRKSGFVVDVVASLADASDAVAVAPYDALLLDRKVPDGDSVTWLQRRRRSGLNAPALFITVKDGVEDRVDGLNAGGDDYLPKPFADVELVARIRALLRRPAGVLGSTLDFGNLTLDTVSREVLIAEKAVPISRREIDLLEHLMRRAGRVVSKAALEEGLYGYDEEVTPNSIEVCVCRLRKTLAGAGASVGVHTVRGVGYMLQ